MNERVRRLRAQYEVQAQALRHRIEMRINRVPKKLWNAKMGDLLLKHATAASSNLVQAAAPVDAKALVDEVKRLRCVNPLSLPRYRVSELTIKFSSSGHDTSESRKEVTSERETKISNTSESLVVAKKRITKKVTSSKVTSSNTCRTGAFVCD